MNTNKPDPQYARLVKKYHESAYQLRRYLSEKFPTGCKVKDRVTGLIYTVKDGSLYADNLNTDKGHVGITFLERINDEKS